MTEILKNTRFFIGQVEDLDDPQGWGRVRVRITILHEGLDREDLPWVIIPATGAGGSGGGGTYNAPSIGSWCIVEFLAPDPLWGVYRRAIGVNREISNILQQDPRANIITYNPETEFFVFRTAEDGFLISLKEASMLIDTNNGIKIQTPETQISLTADGRLEMTGIEREEAWDSRSTITTPELNLQGSETFIGTNPNQSAVSAEILWSFLRALAAGVDAKFPNTGSTFASLAASAETASTSKSVKITL